MRAIMFSGILLFLVGCGDGSVSPRAVACGFSGISWTDASGIPICPPDPDDWCDEVLVGIPVSLFATLGVMLVSGQSINMVSLFGLIMALGIVVDDAIVVGEHAEARSRTGLAPLTAAVTAARRMAPPVFSASLTTICAFVSARGTTTQHEEHDESQSDPRG